MGVDASVDPFSGRRSRLALLEMQISKPTMVSDTLENQTFTFVTPLFDPEGRRDGVRGGLKHQVTRCCAVCVHAVRLDSSSPKTVEIP